MMLEIAGRAAQVLVALAGAYLIVLWFALVVWTFRDIEGRSRSVFTQVFSTLLSVLFFVPGVLLYMLLRPKETLDEAFQRSLEEEYLLQDLEELPHCPSCHRYIEDDFVLCPACHAQLREPCGSCERLVDLRWPLCPYCGVVQSEQSESGDRAEPPAARWTAPGLRRRRLPEGESRPRPAPAALDDDRREVAAAMTGSDAGRLLERGEDDTSSLAASLASGMRSIVRPFDRLLGRGEPVESPRSQEEPAEMEAFTFGFEEQATSSVPYGPIPNGTSAFGEDATQPDHVVVARNRFATNGQTTRHERRPLSGDGFVNGSSGNGTEPEPIVPFPSEAERNGRTAEPTGITWPPLDRDRER
jgi:RNA polymerase subunit RPABC4/transcription elongation factor Spt4